LSLVFERRLGRRARRRTQDRTALTNQDGLGVTGLVRSDEDESFAETRRFDWCRSTFKP
jgi:hypothetical protein